MLKNLKYNIAVIMLMTSCSFVDEIHFWVDPRLNEAVTTVYKEAEVRGNVYLKDRISFIIGDIESTGLCSRQGTFTTITINSAVFKNGQPDKLALEYIVMHEFGHYIGRSHNDKYSIMNPNKYAGTYHNDPVERKKLIDELFE